jgi:hypothetical protein
MNGTASFSLNSVSQRELMIKKELIIKHKDINKGGHYLVGQYFGGYNYGRKPERPPESKKCPTK